MLNTVQELASRLHDAAKMSSFLIFQVECNNFSHYDEEGFRALREGAGNKVRKAFGLRLPGRDSTEGSSPLQPRVGCCVAAYGFQGGSVCNGGIASRKPCVR